MSLRVLIVDDEAIARRGLRQRLAEEPDLEIVGECADGAAAISAIAELRPDLVLLDIQMPGCDGFGVIEAVGMARMPLVIFVTAYDEHALRAFDVHALDYVLKPVDGERLHLAVARARERLRDPESGLDARLAAVLASLGREAPPRWSRRLAIRSPGRITLVDVREIDWLEADGNYVEVHTAAGRRRLRETLAAIESRLDPDVFVRVSRSALVNITRVRELQPMFNGDFVLLMRDGAEVHGSRRHREALDRLLQ